MPPGAGQGKEVRAAEGGAGGIEWKALDVIYASLVEIQLEEVVKP